MPDHDFVKATQHKLCPSVYAGCEIRPTSARGDPEITYSGPTYIAVRSGKHESSTAYTHGRDIRHVLELNEFAGLVKNEEGIVKPIAIFLSDGGADENPRFPRTLDAAIQNFKELDFDVMLVSTLAGGMSAYNNVERRMAPLSKALAGVLLLHDTCGTHLNSSRKTVDVDLEKRNFKVAGEILAQIWSEISLDSFPIVSEYLESETLEAMPIDEKWVAVHCRISQCFLQIVKCLDEACCGNMRTNWVGIFPDRFLPAPVPVRQTHGGPSVPRVNDVKLTDKFPGLWRRLAINELIPASKYSPLPYDTYCPSVKVDVPRRTCNMCEVYYPSIAAKQRHQKACHVEVDEECADDDEVKSDDDNSAVLGEDEAPVLNIFELLKLSTFMGIGDEE